MLLSDMIEYMKDIYSSEGDINVFFGINTDKPEYPLYRIEGGQIYDRDGNRTCLIIIDLTNDKKNHLKVIK